MSNHFFHVLRVLLTRFYTAVIKLNANNEVFKAFINPQYYHLVGCWGLQYAYEEKELPIYSRLLTGSEAFEKKSIESLDL